MNQTAKNFRVAVTGCCDYKYSANALIKQFELLGGLEKYIQRGDSVLIKPNFIAPKPKETAAITHPAIVLETARILKDFGAKPFVGDSPAWGTIFDCVKKLELEEPLKKLGVPVKQLDNPKKCRITDGDSEIGLSSYAIDADKIINLPKFKAHQQMTATFAVKNMYGCVSGKWKAYWHFSKGGREKKFCTMLIHIYKYLAPCLTIIDGITAMEGMGPIRGIPKQLGYLIGGAEPISIETVCAKIINLDVGDLPIVRTAQKIGFGCSDINNIEIIGDGLQICTDFVIPPQIPIRFSLMHVCKSVSKQAILAVKTKFNKPH